MQERVVAIIFMRAPRTYHLLAHFMVMLAGVIRGRAGGVISSRTPSASSCAIAGTGKGLRTAWREEKLFDRTTPRGFLAFKESIYD